MNAFIIEDETLVAKELIKKIEEVAPDIKIQATLPSLKTARNWFRDNAEPDLIFMDVQLSDGVSFELFQQYTINCPIIFATAFNEYAIQAFKTNGVDYLLKPINKTDLKTAIDKSRKLINNNKPSANDIQQLIAALNPSLANHTYKEKFIINFRNSLLPVKTEDIAFFYRENLLYLYTFDHQKHILDYTTLEEIESLLNPEKYYRANRQYIINVDAIKSVHTQPTGKLSLILQPGFKTEIEVSRDKAPSFKKWLDT